ncbi:uncharacterized protein LOC6529778 isoform X2 [Drosophila yakuba]|uniref:Uncharacterized protein, isoform A n=1 Tax=Drosophila yakuba TaxID=7245 RepID=B4PBG0_DROYA|nr:uncharacterized protein LOC6529778 isoform X2 [Drosophila yakuba]EDW90474.1 uncharacterized protein Dyak_GE12620, isoform A [Drosophila yakuba]
MGSRLYPAGIVILHCLLMLLVHVDSKANQNHSENDRQRHLRPHNLHRPPYEGYDRYNHYNRDMESKDAAPNEKEPPKPRSGHLKQKERTAKASSHWMRVHSVYQKEKAELEEWARLKNVTDQELKIFFDGEISTEDKYKLFQDILAVVKILKAVKKKGAVTEKERPMLTPELTPLILKFGRMFEKEIIKNSKTYQALKMLVEEVKTNSTKDNKHKRSRNRHH